MEIFKKLPNHPNIVRFYGGEMIPSVNGGVLALFLMELCDGGSVFDLMQKNMQNKLSEKIIL
jgi:serine/threonine protein kinase